MGHAMVEFSGFEFIARVIAGFARDTPWRVVGATRNKVRLQWGGGHFMDEDEVIRALPVPPFNHAAEQARADAANTPGIRITVTEDGRAVAKLGQWVR